MSAAVTLERQIRPIYGWSQLGLSLVNCNAN